MIGGPLLVTERLILRPPGPEDLDGWAAMTAEPETMRYLGGAKPRAEAWRAMSTMTGAWHLKGFSMFSMILRETGEWIGRAGPWEPEGWPGKEIGWGVKASASGQGYAREAAIASLDYVFDVLGWDDVIHTIDPANARSIALAERLGSAHRGPTQLPAPLDGFPVHAWGQTREEWRAR